MKEMNVGTPTGAEDIQPVNQFRNDVTHLSCFYVEHNILTLSGVSNN